MQKQLVMKVFNYSAALLLLLASWIGLLAVIVMVSYWDGVLEFLLGT